MHLKKTKKKIAKFTIYTSMNFNKTMEQIIPKQFFQQDFASIYKCVVFEINIVKGHIRVEWKSKELTHFYVN